MSYHHTVEAAVESLHEIEDLIRGFPGNRKIPAIEIDLALQKLRSLYELLLLMRGNEKSNHDSSAIFVTAESKTTTVVVNSDIEKKILPVEQKEIAVILEEKKEEKPEKKPARKADGEVQTLADRFKGRTTLLESLSQAYSNEETLAHSKPVTDIMSAIALNDRFTFIRELFGNDKKAFEKAISALNDAASFDEACSYMVDQFSWDMDDEAVKLLLGIVRRKYIR